MPLSNFGCGGVQPAVLAAMERGGVTHPAERGARQCRPAAIQPLMPFGRNLGVGMSDGGLSISSCRSSLKSSARSTTISSISWQRTSSSFVMSTRSSSIRLHHSFRVRIPVLIATWFSPWLPMSRNRGERFHASASTTEFKLEPKKWTAGVAPSILFKPVSPPVPDRVVFPIQLSLQTLALGSGRFSCPHFDFLI